MFASAVRFWIIGAVVVCIAATAVFGSLALGPNMGKEMLEAKAKHEEILEVAGNTAQMIIDGYKYNKPIFAKEYITVTNAYALLEDTENAVKSLKSGIEAFPKEAGLYLALADVYATMGEEEAEKEVLNDGLTNTGSESIKERLEEIND